MRKVWLGLGGWIVAVAGVLVAMPLLAARPAEEIVQQLCNTDMEARAEISRELMDVVLPQIASKDMETRERALAYLSCLHSSALPHLKESQGAKELRPEVRERLGRLCELMERRARIEARTDEYRQWAQRTSIDAYNKVGKRNAAWDANARTGLTFWLAGNQDAQACLKAAEQAIAGGCDDPLVLYTRARLAETLNPAQREQNFRRIAGAAEKLAESEYPVYRKCAAAANMARVALLVGNAETKKQATAAIARAQALLPDAVKEGTSQDALRSLLTIMTQSMIGAGTDSEKVCIELCNAVEKADPKAWAHLWYKGDFYTHYAWDARGAGVARTVTRDGWAKFADRLKIAADALEEGWRRDPGNPWIAQAMLSVELGQGKGRERMELWYRRAMDNAPDWYDNAVKKIYYLEPKWHGSEDDMMQFAAEAEAEGNWYANMPLMVAEAHVRMSESGDPLGLSGEYWTRTGAWPVVERVLDRQVSYFPWNRWYVGFSAKIACKAHQWEKANKLFEQLGDKWEGAAFASKQEFGRYKKLAADQAALAARKK